MVVKSLPTYLLTYLPTYLFMMYLLPINVIMYVFYCYKYIDWADKYNVVKIHAKYEKSVTKQTWNIHMVHKYKEFH